MHTASALTPVELPTAFQESLHLVGRLSDLMVHHVFVNMEFTGNPSEKIAGDVCTKNPIALSQDNGIIKEPNGDDSSVQNIFMPTEDRQQPHDSSEASQKPFPSKFSVSAFNSRSDSGCSTIDCRASFESPEGQSLSAKPPTPYSSRNSQPQSDGSVSHKKRPALDDSSMGSGNRENGARRARTITSATASTPVNSPSSLSSPSACSDPMPSSPSRTIRGKLENEQTDTKPNISPANFRMRWRLTNTDKLNSLIDECERIVGGRKLYVCKFCAKVYEIKSSMRYHMKIIHLQMHLRTTEMQCRICGKQFTCVSAVNRHQAKCVLANCPNGYDRNKPYASLASSGKKLGESINDSNTIQRHYGADKTRSTDCVNYFERAKNVAESPSPSPASPERRFWPLPPSNLSPSMHQASLNNPNYLRTDSQLSALAVPFWPPADWSSLLQSRDTKWQDQLELCVKTMVNGFVSPADEKTAVENYPIHRNDAESMQVKANDEAIDLSARSTGTSEVANSA